MLTLTPFVVKSTAVRICTAAPTSRVAMVVNDGLVPIWLGTADVAANRGWMLSPADVYEHRELDELYAITRGNPAGTVTVDESRS